MGGNEYVIFNDLRLVREEGLLVIELATGPGVSYLGERLLEELAEVVPAAIADPMVEAIFLTGSASGFLSGADVQFFVSCLLANDLDRLLRFTRDAHELLTQINTSDKPIVAWVNGPAIGAGLELALACQTIVAGPT